MDSTPNSSSGYVLWRELLELQSWYPAVAALVEQIAEQRTLTISNVWQQMFASKECRMVLWSGTGVELAEGAQAHMVEHLHMLTLDQLALGIGPAESGKESIDVAQI
jgi:hypothetical protein